MLLYDIVGPKDLESAVRLNAMARYLAVLVGPAVGAAILLALGPAHGIMLNTVFYLPLALWLVNAPYGPRYRLGKPAPRRAVRGLGDIVQTMRDIRIHSVIVSMTLLAGAASFFVGNAYSSQMPGLASDLHRSRGRDQLELGTARECLPKRHTTDHSMSLSRSRHLPHAQLPARHRGERQRSAQRLSFAGGDRQ